MVRPQFKVALSKRLKYLRKGNIHYSYIRLMPCSNTTSRALYLYATGNSQNYCATNDKGGVGRVPLGKRPSTCHQVNVGLQRN